MDFVSNTTQEKKEILSALGKKNFSELIKNLPEETLYQLKDKSLPLAGMTEMEVVIHLQNLASKNKTTEHLANFLGGGCYNHFIPTVVGAMISRGEFLTAYTPYQPEASQGTLQATFEFQTMIAELYGMDVANASLYDGASALAEAALLSLRETQKNKILVSSAIHPEYRKVIRTYLGKYEIEEIALEEGQTSLKDMEKKIDDNVASVLIQSPNYFGLIEEGSVFADLCHSKGLMLLVSANPLSLGILSPPGEYGADIATGEGQPLGLSMNFGGPYLGLFACNKKYMRKIPGRLAGLTKDMAGNSAFTLTLQTREQHIRREKATSNICTNEALMALAATVHLSLLGPQGLKEVAELNLKKAHYVAQEIAKIPGFKLAFNRPYFNEFVVQSQSSVQKVQDHLVKKGINAVIDIGQSYPQYKNCFLLCVTESNSKNEIDHLLTSLKES